MYLCISLYLTSTRNEQQEFRLNTVLVTNKAGFIYDPFDKNTCTGWRKTMACLF